MNSEMLLQDNSKIRDTICRVGLSLDSFLLNGIPYGVIHGHVFNGFLERAAGTLVDNLTALEAHCADDEPAMLKTVAALKTICQQLIGLARELTAFRSMPFDKVQACVCRIPLVRSECVHMIGTLEYHFRAPESLSRSMNSFHGMSEFLANLQRLFAEEWSAANDHTNSPDLPQLLKSN